MLKIVLLKQKLNCQGITRVQNNEYGQEGMYIGVPAIINKDGVREILQLKLNDEDQAKFNHSCEIMKENIEKEIDPIVRN